MKKIEKVEEKVEKTSFAMEMLQFSKEQNKVLEKNNRRMFIIILVLIAAVISITGAFVYYVNTTGYEEITETADTNDGGNACVGDNCNNGEIDYGNSKKENQKESKNRVCKKVQKLWEICKEVIVCLNQTLLNKKSRT